MKKRWILFVCALLMTTVSASEKPRFESKPRDAAITVDGRFDDWYGNLEPFGNAPVSVQFLNDGEFLYMRMTATDGPTRMQIVRQGFTVWFDPAGGTKKRLGIRYPVVERGRGGDDERGGRGGGFGGFGGGRRRSGGDERPGGGADETAPADRVDILGPGKDDARSLTRDHLPGLDVAIRTEQGMINYELKVPLVKTSDRPYAIDATPGKPVGVGLETPKMEQRAFGGPNGGGFGGGGMGGRGGGGRGGRGGGMRGGGGQRGFQPPKPLDVWGLVTIPQKPKV